MSQLYYDIKICLEDSKGLESVLYNEYVSTFKNSKYNRGLGAYYKIKDSDLLIKNKDYCIICLQKYKQGEYKRIIICNHTFHKKCIDTWFKKSNNFFCPICRKSHEQLN